MRNVWTVAKREFNMYFASPVAYAIAFVLLLILGIFFYGDFALAATQGGTPDDTQTIGLFAFLLLIGAGLLLARRRTPLVSKSSRCAFIK